MEESIAAHHKTRIAVSFKELTQSLEKGCSLRWPTVFRDRSSLRPAQAFF